jgi:hypothetical protein
MMPSHWESAVQDASKSPHVLATQEQVLGHLTVEQSTLADATVTVEKMTDFMVLASRE